MIAQVIQTILAPGLMISACGLLLLGTNNKYSIVVGRIRALNDEKRRYLLNSNQISEQHQQRINNINNQLKLFHKRVAIIRNAVVSYTLAVALFVITSFLIAFSINRNSNDIIILLFFLAGMLSVLIGSIFMVIEIFMGYKIVTLEVIND